MIKHTSKIESLITELCPDGVDYLPLGDLCVFNRGKWIKASELSAGPIPVITSAQDVSLFHSESNRDGDTITIASSGAYAGFVSYWDAPIYLSNAFSLDLDESRLCTKYVYYFLKTKQDHLYDLAKGAGVPNVYGKDVASIIIPVPPLSVQEEIVRILNCFTELETELEAELEERKKQYEHYRSQLLTFEEGEVRWIPLGEIGKVSMCKRIFKNETSVDGDIPFYKIGTFGKQPDAYISREVYDQYRRKFSFPKKGDVLLSASGTIGRRVIYNGEPAYFQDSNIIWIDNDESKVLNKFLYHFYAIVQWTTEGGTIQRLYNDNLKKIKIPVPDIAEQKRIVSVLDTFDALVGDMSIGLPAEIKARRKQYEYYRGQLLTFEEKVV